MSKKKVNLFVPIVAVVVISLLAVLIGCQEKKNSVPPEALSQQLSCPFTATAKIKMKDMTMQADINKSSEQAFTFRILEPENLKDLQFTYDGEDMQISYKGMSVSVADDSLIAKGMAAVMMRAINASSQETGISVKQKDGALLLNGKSEDGKFSMTLDKKNGSILSMELPELDLECQFDEFVFHKKEQQETGNTQSEENVSGVESKTEQ